MNPASKNLLPREKLMELGSGALTEAELVAILLRTGSQSLPVLQLSAALLDHFGHSLVALYRSPPEEVKGLCGMGSVKAITLKAALELGVRFYRELLQKKDQVDSPKDIYELCIEMCFQEQETVRVISLDSKSHVIAMDDITRGISNASLIHPREVFKKAIWHSAVSIALVHNHPSGDPFPSFQDRDVTEKMKSAGELLGIQLVDHVIVGKGSFYSFTLQKVLEGGILDAGSEPGSREIAETQGSH
ncbi:MAG TPA: DNA repair protein RadC [Thermotogota bacterium]|nr:DNA repair protein RadC [Thermotogota bacterium]HRW92211.1 DNA repair protein RadC [Thermotogota bacterium]